MGGCALGGGRDWVGLGGRTGGGSWVVNLCAQDGRSQSGNPQLEPRTGTAAPKLDHGIVNCSSRTFINFGEYSTAMLPTKIQLSQLFVPFGAHLWKLSNNAMVTSCSLISEPVLRFARQPQVGDE